MALKIQTVIMAAGEGTRMRSKKSKVLHEILGRTLLDWMLHAAPESTEKPVVIVGRNEEQVRAVYGDRILYAVQKERLGTGHAVMMAQDEIERSDADAVLIIAGDMPLFRSDFLEDLCRPVLEGKADAAVLTAIFDDPTGYGRILRDSEGHITGVVEQKDATEEERAIREVNVSGYCVKRDVLIDALGKLTNDNAQHEYYLTDIIYHMVQAGKSVLPVICGDPDACLGINDRAQLAVAAKKMQERINLAHMKNGVTLEDPQNTYIGADVQIGRDTVIGPGCILRGKTVIGEDCVLTGACIITDSVIGDGAKVTASALTGAKIGAGADVGPYAVL
ncbi:MAG: NTP transferase domain-containing protein [Clostridia bacterium]|nr:NTP transferase domain-containing protein [Clostridia bacterium]